MYCWRFLTMSSKPSSFLRRLYPFLQHVRPFSRPCCAAFGSHSEARLLSVLSCLFLRLFSLFVRLFGSSLTQVVLLFSVFDSLLQCSAIISPDLVSFANVSLPWSLPQQIKMLQCRDCIEERLLIKYLSRSLIVIFCCLFSVPQRSSVE